MTPEKFNLVREKYGLAASWAIWAAEGERPKSNMGDLSMFEGSQIESTCELLHTKFILVGLNISTKDISDPLSNFHGENGEVYKARFALRSTPLWGSYMTDIIKDMKESEASRIVRLLRMNPDIEKVHVRKFREELEFLNAVSPILVAFGSDVHDILSRHFDGEFRIVKIPHYAWRVNKEKYRDKVLECLSEL